MGSKESVQRSIQHKNLTKKNVDPRKVVEEPSDNHVKSGSKLLKTK